MIGRFISADTTDVLTVSPTSLTDKNLYAYCDNNPIMRTDRDGRFWFTVAGAVVGGILGAGSKIISNALSGNKLTDGLVGAVVGGMTYGAIATSPILKTTMGPYINGIASYASAAAESIANEVVSYANGKNLTVDNLKKSVIKVAKDTVVEGTQTYLAGRTAGGMVKTNRNWIRPKKIISSFTGKYAKKVWKQSGVQAFITTGSNVIRGWLK